MNYFDQIIIIVAFLVSVFNLWDKIDARKKALKEPRKNLEERIKKLEDLQTSYDVRFSRDLQRIESIEEGNRVTQKALLALLNHAIDGNDVEGIKEASKDLNKYLINR